MGAAVGDEFDAEVEPGGGEAGAEGDGAAVVGDGLRVLAEFAVGEGLGEVEFCNVWVELGGGLEAGQAFGELVAEGEGVAQAVVGGGDGGVELEGVSEDGFGLSDLAQGGERVAEVGPGECVELVCREGGLGHVQGWLELAALAGDEA